MTLAGMHAIEQCALCTCTKLLIRYSLQMYTEGVFPCSIDVTLLLPSFLS